MPRALRPNIRVDIPVPYASRPMIVLLPLVAVICAVALLKNGVSELELIVKIVSVDATIGPNPSNRLPLILCKLVLNTPALILPLTPRPPTTTNAPVVVFVLAVPEAATMFPDTIAVLLVVNVVNAPVLAELASIGEPFILPPLITALAVLKFVVTPVVAYTLAIPVK